MARRPRRINAGAIHAQGAQDYANPFPRPPDPTAAARNTLAQNLAGGTILGSAGTYGSAGQPTRLGTQPTPGRAPQAAPQAAPTAAPPKTQPPGVGGAPIYADATYVSRLATDAFTRQQQFDALQEQGRQDQGDTGEAVRRLLISRMEGLRNVDAQAARANLTFSGHRQRQRDDFTAASLRSEGDVRLGSDRREAARIAARRALEQGRPLEEAAAAAEAVDRQMQRDASAAQLNALAPTPGTPATATAATPTPPHTLAEAATAYEAAKRAAGGKTRKNGKVLARDGRWISPGDRHYAGTTLGFVPAAWLQPGGLLARGGR